MQDRPVVLYDANVLYPAQLRDFLMRLALGGGRSGTLDREHP